jgi:RNA polymerase sigma factor (sigma-70 family)
MAASRGKGAAPDGGQAMSRFRTTRWSLLMDAREATPLADGALDQLCRIYRPPVLAFIRRQGHAEAAAQDLTQSFFEQLLRLRTYAAADPARGRFRVFLQVALRRFLSNQRVAAHAQRRGGGQAVLSLDDGPEVAADEADTPDAAFERDWAHAVLREALVALQAEAEAAGKLTLFQALRPFLFEPPDSDEYAQLAATLGMRRNTLAVAIHRLRQRLHDKVRAELAETVAVAADVDAEMGVLQASLGARLEAEAPV